MENQEKILINEQEHTPENVINQDPIVVQEPKNNAEQENWRRVRERQEAIEKELAIERKKREEYEKMLFTKKQESTSEGSHTELNPDDIPSWSDVQRKYDILEKQIKNYQQQAVMNAAELQLKAKYPDFDAIVNESSINTLRSLYPEIAQTISSGTDLYSKGASAYAFIKNLGLTQKNVAQEKATIETNSTKPRASNSISAPDGASPLNHAHSFSSSVMSEDERKKRYQDMLSILQRSY